MGCDIHLFVESRDLVDTHWFNRDKWTYDPYDDEHTRLRVDYKDAFYSGRNYSLFSVLAGARNYDDVQPIDAPRGLPADVTAPVKAESDMWGIDGHSHSWFTLHELQNFDWDGHVIQKTRWVGLEEYRRCKAENRAPESYCGDTFGRSVRKYTEAHYLEEVKYGFVPNPDLSYYIQYTWSQSYRAEIGREWWECLEKMAKLHKDPTKVRTVFWFDN